MGQCAGQADSPANPIPPPFNFPFNLPDEHLPKKILFGKLQVRKRSHGGQKKRYKDTLKDSLKTSAYQQSRGNKLHRIKVARPHKKGC